MTGRQDVPFPIAQTLAEASLHEQRGRLDEAARLFSLAVEAEPQRHDVWHQLGVVAFKRDRLDEAAELMLRAVALAPEVAAYRRNACELLRRLGRLDEALDQGRRATALDPLDAEARYNLALVLGDRLETEAAIESLREALRLQPRHAGAHFELGEALLATGRFAEGWEEFEWRFRIPGAWAPAPPGGGRAWGGEPLRGRLLVIADQGFGDIIQFSRFLPRAAALCDELVVIATPEAQPLVARIPGVAVATARWADAAGFEAYAILSGLPRLFGIALEDLPGAAGYLTAEPEAAARWRGRLDQALPAGLRRVGLAWSGREAFGGDRSRSMAFDDLAPLARTPGLALVSLQLGPAREALAGYAGPAPLFDAGPEITNFADTLAIVAGLDAVVSIDTSVAHLAGAMGRPVCVLLRHAADWRWMLGRSDSPWYPSATLCRQTAPGRWDTAVATAVERLRAV